MVSCSRVIKGLDHFKEVVNMIVANRMADAFRDVGRAYTRELFESD